MRSLTRFDRALAFTVVGLASAALSGSALADVPALTDFTMTLDVMEDGLAAASGNWAGSTTGSGWGQISDYGDWEVPGADGTWEGYQYTGGYNPGAGWGVSWNVVFNADPFVTANLSVTNTSAITQTFSILMSLPIAPALGSPTQLSGSIAGNLTDNPPLTGASMGVPGAGDSLYTGYIDGNVAATLGTDFSFSTTGGLASITPLSFTDNNGPAAGSTIAVEIQFTLSAGDSANLTAIFEVVPGPGALSAFAVMGLVVGRRRRRS